MRPDPATRVSTDAAGDGCPERALPNAQRPPNTVATPAFASGVTGSCPETDLPEALRSVAGEDPALQSMLARVAKLVNTRMSLLIQGETGTGKEYLAKACHSASARASKPFVVVNCAALPETLIESELFGYESGAFTGASAKGRLGLLREAEGGTLFLDEIGEMPLAMQSRLLRVLAEREVTPIGRTRPVPLDVRFIVATHRELFRSVQAGAFRDDLYFRISAAVLTLPPLRQRADFDWLVDRILAALEAQNGRRYFLTASARSQMRDFSWPGNVRELVNCMEYACALCTDGVIRTADLPEHLQVVPVSNTLQVIAREPPPAAESSEALLRAALQQHNWNIAAVARDFRVHRSTVYRRMQRSGIRSECA